MKRTKNMYYRETLEAEELYLYAINDNWCYTRIITPALAGLERKAKKGVYDPDKAVDSFFRVTTACAVQYEKEFGAKFFNVTFDVTDRFTAAVKMEERFRDQIYGLE